MKETTLSYFALVRNSWSYVSRALDPLVRTDALQDAELLRQHVSLIVDDVPEVRNDKEGGEVGFDNSRFLRALDENSRNLYSNEILRFVQATSSPDVDSDPFLLWKTHEFRFPSLSENAKDVLPVQASSMALES